MIKKLVLLLWVCSQMAMAQSAAADGPWLLRQRLDSVVEAHQQMLERTQLGLCVYDLTADSMLYGRGERQQMRPASTQKVLTAVAALDMLGTSYRYRTTLSVIDSVGEGKYRAPALVVRGCMDPRLGAEDLRAFVQAVRTQGIDTVSAIILDLSKKDTLRLGWGWCWDDKITPLTPMLYGGRDNFARNFIQALRADSIVVDDVVSEVYSSPIGARRIDECSASIDQILLPMMKRSNNLYAESLFYQMGRTRTVVADRMMQWMRSIGIDTSGLRIADGSGLSLYNYTTPLTLVQVLRYAYRKSNIYSHLQPALPLAGSDGTLKKRMTTGSAHNNVMAKTGTVTGVSSLAGYALGPDGHLLAFAIINQGLYHDAGGHRFQDAVCQALCTPLQSALPQEESLQTDADDASQNLVGHEGTDTHPAADGAE